MTQQHFETFDLTIENDIAHICLNRPDKRNSMIPLFWEDLPTVVQDIDNGAKARVIVISSSGPVFTAGMDLNALRLKRIKAPTTPSANAFAMGRPFTIQHVKPRPPSTR